MVRGLGDEGRAERPMRGMASGSCATKVKMALKGLAGVSAINAI